MGITSDFFVKGEMSLGDICKLYYDIRKQEEDITCVSKYEEDVVVRGILESTLDKVKENIEKVKKHNLDAYFFFRESTKKLEEVYKDFL